VPLPLAAYLFTQNSEKNAQKHFILNQRSENLLRSGHSLFHRPLSHALLLSAPLHPDPGYATVGGGTQSVGRVTSLIFDKSHFLDTLGTTGGNSHCDTVSGAMAAPWSQIWPRRTDGHALYGRVTHAWPASGRANRQTDRLARRVEGMISRPSMQLSAVTWPVQFSSGAERNRSRLADGVLFCSAWLRRYPCSLLRENLVETWRTYFTVSYISSATAAVAVAWSLVTAVVVLVTTENNRLSF